MNIDTTNFMYEWVIDGNRFRAKEVDYCFPGPGNYLAQLNVIDMLSGETMFNQDTYDLVIEDIEQAYISSPDTILVNETVILDATETFLKDFEIGRYIWNTGDLSYVADSVITHTYYKPGVFTVRLGVTEVTDTPEDTRQTCSYKRLVVLPLNPDAVSSTE
jgi:hypothetical protein